MTNALPRTGPVAAVRGGGPAMLAVLLTGQAMSSMDTSIAAVAGPAIRDDLAASAAVTQLVLAGYTLAFGVFVVTGARLGARYGYSRIFQLGLTAFTAASAACGLAPQPWVLVVARVFQGLAGALLVPQVLSLIQREFTGARRDRAIGWYSLVLALGVAAGQIVGGLLVTWSPAGLAWRAAFLINVPIGVLLLVAGRRHLPGAGPGAGRPDRLDPIGIAGLAGAMTVLVLPLVLGRDLGWPGPLRAVLVLVGAAGLVGVLARQRRLGRRGGQPLLDLSVLRFPSVPAGLTACFLIMGCYASLLFVLTLRLQDGLGFSALDAGLAFVPYAAGFAVASLTAPRLPARAAGRLPVTGPLMMTVTVAMVAVISRDGWPWLPASALLLLAGAGHAAGFSPLVGRMSGLVPPAAAASLSALISTGTLLASVLGVAAVGAFYLASAGPEGGRSAGAFGAATAILGAVLLVVAIVARRALR
ncbi:MFS transporter [Plantactinospora sp. GCM10030261]|uniref:MFS transporter n=1 Tax=Plantactinospora sp. GCM10030261 TaxID=3273420 RepID=UPI00361ABB84